MTRSIPHILRFLLGHLKGHRLQATLNTLVGSCIVAADLGFVWATKLAVDIATGHRTSPGLGWAFCIIAAMMAARIFFVVASRWIQALLGVKAQNNMRKYIFGHLLQCSWSDLRSYHTGNLTNRLERDVTDVVNFSTETVPSFITTTLQFVGAFLFLFLMDNTLALIIVCIIPFFVITGKLYVKRMRELSRQTRDHESRIQAILQETLQHALVVKTLQRTDYFTHILHNRQEQLHRCVLTRTRYATLSATLLNLGFATGYFVTFAWGATSLAAGQISYGAMLAFVQLVGQIQGPVRNLTKFIPIFISSFTAAERLMELEALQNEKEEPIPQPLHDPLGIDLHHVSFSYTPASRTIIQQLSYSFPPGTTTAIVGETGAGKTTLIRLLLALVYPTEGHICITDSSGQSIPISAASRRLFSYVPQGNTLFSGTVRSNLQQAKPDATEEEMFYALHTAAADFVNSKPLGLDTPCGEAGGGLSEGQAQRIAIARALLAGGRILILDEATSALDPATEQRVLQQIAGSYPHHTTIIITHRPEALKYADQCLRL